MEERLNEYFGGSSKLPIEQSDGFLNEISEEQILNQCESEGYHTRFEKLMINNEIDDIIKDFPIETKSIIQDQVNLKKSALRQKRNNVENRKQIVLDFRKICPFIPNEEILQCYSEGKDQIPQLIEIFQNPKKRRVIQETIAKDNTFSEDQAFEGNFDIFEEENHHDLFALEQDEIYEETSSRKKDDDGDFIPAELNLTENELYEYNEALGVVYEDRNPSRSSRKRKRVSDKRKQPAKKKRKTDDDDEEEVADSKKNKRKNKRKKRMARLQYNDLIRDVTCQDGWSEARKRAFADRERNPNEYYYRFLDPGEIQKKGQFTPEEHKNFLKLVKKWDLPHRDDRNWGQFSREVPGRVGYQCANYYRSLIEDGFIEDRHFGIVDGKVKILHRKLYGRRNQKSGAGGKKGKGKSRIIRARKYNAIQTNYVPGYRLGKTDDYINPLPGYIDIVTQEEVKLPKMCPHGYVLDDETWKRIKVCPFTKQKENKRAIEVLTIDNVWHLFESNRIHGVSENEIISKEKIKQLKEERIQKEKVIHEEKKNAPLPAIYKDEVEEENRKKAAAKKKNGQYDIKLTEDEMAKWFPSNGIQKPKEKRRGRRQMKEDREYCTRSKVKLKKEKDELEQNKRTKRRKKKESKKEKKKKKTKNIYEDDDEFYDDEESDNDDSGDFIP